MTAQTVGFAATKTVVATLARLLLAHVSVGLVQEEQMLELFAVAAAFPVGQGGSEVRGAAVVHWTHLQNFHCQTAQRLLTAMQWAFVAQVGGLVAAKQAS